MAEHELHNMQIGLFPNRRSAEAAVAAMREKGYAESSLHLRRPSDAPRARYAEGIFIGIAGGAVLGLIVGAVLGFLISKAAPGVGPVDDNTGAFVITGIFAVFGFLSGATAGGLFGMAAVADPAHFLNQELESGRYLLGVDAVGEEQEKKAEADLDESAPDDVIFVPAGETLERVFHGTPARASLEPAARG